MPAKDGHNQPGYNRQKRTILLPRHHANTARELIHAVEVENNQQIRLTEVDDGRGQQIEEDGEMQGCKGDAEER